MNENEPPVIVLHMDINKTIILNDPAAGKTTEDMVNDILASACWGTVHRPTITSPLIWEAYSVTPTIQPPSVEVDGMSPDDKRAINRVVKDKRTSLVNRFTSPGQPGERYHNDWIQLTNSLKNHSTGKYVYILPSFFQLILHLTAKAIAFRLVFRTFGVDLQAVFDELNEFCRGEVDPVTHVGSFFRNKDGTWLAIGTIAKPPSLEQGLDFYKGMGLDMYSGYGKIYHVLCDMWERHHCIGLTDYYDWWASNNENGSAGKLFLVDPANTKYTQIFFDDNIEVDGGLRNIVDVRDPVSGVCLPLKQILGHNLIRVEPLEAIRDVNYFVNQLEAALTLQ